MYFKKKFNKILMLELILLYLWELSSQVMQQLTFKEHKK